MPSQLAILAVAAVATAGGGVPGANACVNRRSIPHLHTPCSPNHCINEQVEAATKSAQATVGGSRTSTLHTHWAPELAHPSLDRRSAINLTDGWQVYQMASRGPHPPIPAALHPARTVPSTSGAQGATYEPTVPACDPSPKPTESRASPPTHDVPMCPSSPTTTHMRTLTSPTHTHTTPHRPRHHHHPPPPPLSMEKLLPNLDTALHCSGP